MCHWISESIKTQEYPQIVTVADVTGPLDSYRRRLAKVTLNEMDSVMTD